MPELRQLRVFVAVAEELNFTRAAERLFVGQQATSKSVRQLERELGVALLERTSHDVALTPAGADLLHEGRAALAAVDAAFERARGIGRATSGTVSVGVSPAIGPTERDALVAALRADADVTVTLRELRPEDAARLLRDREIELALARMRPAAPEVTGAALAPTPASLYVPATHWLARCGESVAVAELEGERLLTWSPPGTPFTDLLVARLRAASARVEPVQASVSGAASSLNDLQRLNAVAIAAPRSPKHEGIVELTLADDIALPLVVLWRAGVPSPAVERVRAAMSDRQDCP